QGVGEGVAFDHRRIEEGRAVLGDVDRRIAIAILDPDQGVGERGGADLPAGLRVRGARLRLWPRLQEPGVRIEARDAARVIVDAEEVDGLPDERGVVGWPPRTRLAEHLAQL